MVGLHVDVLASMVVYALLLLVAHVYNLPKTTKEFLLSFSFFIFIIPFLLWYNYRNDKLKPRWDNLTIQYISYNGAQLAGRAVKQPVVALLLLLVNIQYVLPNIAEDSRTFFFAAVVVFFISTLCLRFEARLGIKRRHQTLLFTLLFSTFILAITDFFCFLGWYGGLMRWLIDAINY